MSSIGDSSRISDISSISRFSRSSGIRPSTKIDSALNISECQASSTIREPINKFGGSIVNNYKRITKLISSCDEAICNYAKLKLLLDCVRRAVNSDGGKLENSVQTNLKNILTVQDVKKFLPLPTADDGIDGKLTLLGITASTQCQLSHNEKRDINSTVENIFLQKMNNFVESYENFGGKIEEITKKQESLGKKCFLESHESDSIRWNDSMNELCAEYYRDLITCADILRQWERLKYVEMNNLNLKNAENLLLEAEVCEVRSNILKKNCALQMYNETPKTLEAFGILREILDAQIREMREKIKKKEILKMAYADVSGNDYDQILIKYTEICNVIKKKERLLKML